MTSSRQTSVRPGKAGMWSTITEAVQAGWGPTARLLAVFALLGLLVVGIAVVAGDSGIATGIRALLAAVR